MPEKSKQIITILLNNNNTLLKMLVFMRNSIPHLEYLSIIIISLKFIGLFILSNFFYLANNTPSKDFINLLRSVTAYNLYARSSSQCYINICCALYAFIIIYLVVLFLAYFKTNSENGFSYIKILTVYNIIWMLTCQHIIELLSFGFYIDAADSNWALLGFNAIGILITNFIIYVLFRIFNTAYDNEGQLFHFNIDNVDLIFALFFTNLQGFHFIDNFLNRQTLIILKSIIYSLILFLFVIIFIKRLRKFVKLSFLNTLIQFIYFYCFFSILLEIIISVLNISILTMQNVISLIFIKIVATSFFLIINYFNTRTYFRTQSGKVLFKEYSHAIYSQNELQIFNFFQVLILQKENKAEEVLEIIYSHKSQCNLHYCICKKINLDTSEINAGIILENIYNRLNFIKDKDINLLYFNYLFKIKKNEVFAYGILMTYLHKNKNRISLLDKVSIYSLLVEIIVSFKLRYTAHETDYLNFKEVVNRITLNERFDKLFKQVIGSYDFFIEFKEKFDNCLKYENGVINSYIFKDIDELVKYCQTFKKDYKSIKDIIMGAFTNSKCQDKELSYKLQLFFKLFNKNVPTNLNRLLGIEAQENILDLIKAQHLKGKSYNILFSINKIFEVKYFSYKLAERLGYEHSTLIGSDVHSIFPLELRDFHKKAIIKYLLIDNKIRFIRKSFIFSNHNTILPMNIKALPFISFSDHLEILCDIELISEEKNTYYFVLDSYFNIMSINKNFQDTYFLDYKLCKKLQLDILKLMNIPQSIVAAGFKTALQHIYSQSEVKQFFAIFSDFLGLNFEVSEFDRAFSIKQYHNTLKNSETKADVSTKGDLITEKSITDKSIRNLLVKKDNITLLNDNRRITTINLYKEKENMIQTLEKIKDRQLDLDLNDSDITKIEESLSSLRTNGDLVFKIRIDLKSFIDSVFYLIKIRETHREYVSPDFNSMSASKVVRLQPDVIFSPFIVNQKKNATNKKLGRTFIANRIDGIGKRDYIKKVFKFNKHENTSSASITDLKSFKDTNNENKTTTALIILLIALVVLYTFIFIFKGSFLTVITNCFLTEYWLNYQISSLSFLHSSVITYMSTLAGLTSTNKPSNLTNNQENIQFWTNSYRNSFNNLYNNFNDIEDQSLLSIYSQTNSTFYKLSIDWNEIKSQSDIFTELNYLQYTTYQLSLYDPTSLADSLKNKFLFYKYKNDMNEQITDAERILYYINRNIPVILNIFYNSEGVIFSAFEAYFYRMLFIIYMIEGTIIALFIVLIILVKIILSRYDKKFFRIILLMFIKVKNPKDSCFKTPTEVQTLKKYLKTFKLILENIEYTEENTSESKQPEENNIQIIEKPSSKSIISIRSGRIMLKTSDRKQTLGSSTNTVTTTQKDNATQSNMPLVSDLKSLFKVVKKEKESQRFDKNGNLIQSNTGENYIITNNHILTETKHHKLKIIKLSKVLLFIGFLIFSVLSLSNILASTNRFEYLNQAQVLCKTFIGGYSLLLQLFNYVRLSVFSNDKALYNYIDYNTLVSQLIEVNKNSTTYINENSAFLPTTYDFLNSIISSQGVNKEYICQDEDTCQLNSKGLMDGYNSALMFISLIYEDFQKKAMVKPMEDDIRGSFNSSQYMVVNKELEDVIGNIHNKIFTLVNEDFIAIVDNFLMVLSVLGIITLLFIILIILFVTFIFLKRIRLYMNSLLFTAYKFNSTLFS
jgi:hypothetical protein